MKNGDHIEAATKVSSWLAGELGTPVPGLLARAGDFGAPA